MQPVLTELLFKMEFNEVLTMCDMMLHMVLKAMHPVWLSIKNKTLFSVWPAAVSSTLGAAAACPSTLLVTDWNWEQAWI